VIVVVSAIWQTTCTAVRSGDEGFVIDSPVLPDELDALPGVFEQAGFPVSGLLCTHADWDHLLGRLAFPEASLGCGERSAGRLDAEAGSAQRKLRAFDEEYYVSREKPLGLAGIQSLPVPGQLSLGDIDLNLYPAGGHTADGMAIWLAGPAMLVCGDYLSPVEIPMISEGGSVEAYLATLELLEPLVGSAQTVIPGHGAPLDGPAARRVLEEDIAYVRGLASGGGLRTPLPRARRTAEQKRIHQENVGRLR